MPYQRVIIRNLSEFFEDFAVFSETKPNLCWFRGQKQHYHPLIPSAYRYNNYKDNSRKTEKESIDAAKASMYHFSETKDLNTDDVFWLSFMQHNGIPTRFLDWSLEFQVGLYFAFEGYLTGHANPGDLPCIWVFKPKMFMDNLRSYLLRKRTRKPFGLAPAQVDDACGFLNDNYLKNSISVKKLKDVISNRIYVPFTSSYVNERVKMQSGCFVRFPLLPTRKNIKPQGLDAFIDSNTTFSSCISKYIFIHPDKILREVSSLNLETERIYPEVQNIASRIKRGLFENNP